jgi:hypothetical protein
MTDAGGSDGDGERPSSWRTVHDDGTYTLHTIGYGDVTLNADYETHVGDCTDCVSWEEAVSGAPSEGGTLHVHGGTWSRGLPTLGKHTTVIGHDRPVFEPEDQYGAGPAADGWLVIRGVKMQDTTLWSSGDPAPRGLFVIDSELDGHREGAIFTSQGCGLLEVWDTEIYDGGQGNVRHNVYSHCDVTVGKNVYSHSARGSHAWKVVSDKQVLIDSYIANVNRDTISQFGPLTRCVYEYFEWGSDRDCGKRPDEDGGPTGDWAEHEGWSLSDWRSLYEQFETISGSVGTTPVDMISCADTWIEDTTVGFLRVPATRVDNYVETGTYALQFRHRRTEIGGCDKPGWWEDAFYEPETWEIGAVTDPQNADMMTHFIGPDVELNVVGPQKYQVTDITNRGTQPIDRSGSGGTREGVEDKDMPPYWIEKSRVFVAGGDDNLEVLETQTEQDRCTSPCTTTEAERRAAIYQDSDPANWPALNEVLGLN